MKPVVHLVDGPPVLCLTEYEEADEGEGIENEWRKDHEDHEEQRLSLHAQLEVDLRGIRTSAANRLEVRIGEGARGLRDAHILQGELAVALRS